MRHTRTVLRSLAAAVAATVLLAPAANAQGQGGSAEITVEFHDDDMGYNVTSTKGLSNLIHEYCDGTFEKIEFGDELLNYTHNDTQLIVGVWVKSGSNHAEDEGAPPGAGERFDNEGVECGEIPVFSTVAASLAAVALGSIAYFGLRRRS